MVFDGGKLTFLLCMVLGLLGPRGQGEVCSHGIPDCRGRQWCPKVGPSQLGSSAMGAPEIRAEIHWDIQFSLCTPHAHVLHLDSCQTGAVVQGAAQFLLQMALVTYAGDGVESDSMDWPRGSLVAQLNYKNILSWINNRANTGAEFAKEPPFYYAVDTFSE